LGIYIRGEFKVFITPLLSMSQKSALESNIDKLRKYAQTPNLKPQLVNNIKSLITEYNSITQLGGEDMNKNMNVLETAVSIFMTENDIGPVSYEGGRRRKSASSSRPRRRSSKKRGTQRKQKRRQRRGSRRA